MKACARGSGPWLLVLVLLNAGLGVFEAVLFQLMGLIIDWLGQYGPEQLWAEKKHTTAGDAGADCAESSLGVDCQ